MATHSSIIGWRIPWTEEPGGLQSMGSQSWRGRSDWHFHFFFSYIFRGLEVKTTRRYKYIPIRMAKKNLIPLNAGKDVEQ